MMWMDSCKVLILSIFISIRIPIKIKDVSVDPNKNAIMFNYRHIPE